MTDYLRQNKDKFARDLVNSIELITRRDEAWAVKRPDHVQLLPPFGFRHDVTGRQELQPDPPLILVGRYFRRSRLFAGMSQQRLADRTGVSQSMVSRTECGLAPGMGFERFVDMTMGLGRLFPLGTCPHEHDCPWQPIKPPEHQTTAVERLVETILNPADAEQIDVQEAEGEPEGEGSFIDDLQFAGDD